MPKSKRVSPNAPVFNDEVPITFCPGCGHGTVNILLSEVVAEMGLQKKLVFVVGVGCGTMSMHLQRLDRVATPHGRASDVATGISRVMPDRVLVQYSGDGDACAIGLAGLLHACARRENFIVLIYNNNVYGMTGGQLGPTTSEGVPTTTFLAGREKEIQGYPLDILSLVKQFPGCVFAAREILTTGQNIFRARKSLEKAFKIHQDGVKGIKLIDFLGNCNVNWKGEKTFTPVTANALIDNEISKNFELGTVKVPEGYEG